MLDISILSANKYLTSEKRKEEFIYTQCVVTQKVDGIKVTLIKISDTGENLKDFIVSYKNNIIYPTEYEYASTQKIKQNSINNSQFKIFFEHLQKYDLSQIPKGIEFSIEFACKKPTLSSNYTKHGFILLAYCKSTYKISGGKIRFNSGERQVAQRAKFAKIFRFGEPVVLFEGILANFAKGIKDKDLQSAYSKISNSLNPQDIDTFIQKITELFLSLDSKFGGKEEGCVIEFKNGIILKIQQSYQTDQSARAAIKMRYKEEDPQKEQQYWDSIRLTALNLVSGIPQSNEKNIGITLEILGKKLKYLKHGISHSKKSDLQILDDIQTTAKNILIRRMKGNNGALFLGKFRILTTAHYGIIEYGLKNFDTLTVCLVSNKETKAYDHLRLEMLKLCFGNKIEVIQHSSGHIFSIINKSQNNINTILCGTDRYQDYVNQVKSNPDINVVETPRTDEDISASKVIDNLDNYAYFCMKTPQQIRPLYKEIKEVFKK